MADFIANVELDERTVKDFYEALDAYADVRRDSRDFEYCLNRAAKDVAFRAAQLTHHAAVGDLRSMLGQGAKGCKSKATTAAAAILAARMTKAGKNPRKMYDSATWDEKVRKFVGRTLASVNFMRSGWLPAARELQGLVRESSGSVEKCFGRTEIDERGEFAKHAYPVIGGVLPARPVSSDNVAVELWNESTNPRSSTTWSKGLGKYGVEGLNAALASKAQDMWEYVAKALDARAERMRLTNE